MGIGIPDLLLNFLSRHGCFKNNDSIFILKCRNRMFEYENNLEKLPSEIKRHNW